MNLADEKALEIKEEPGNDHNQVLMNENPSGPQEGQNLDKPDAKPEPCIEDKASINENQVLSPNKEAMTTIDINNHNDKEQLSAHQQGQILNNHIINTESCAAKETSVTENASSAPTHESSASTDGKTPTITQGHSLKAEENGIRSESNESKSHKKVKRTYPDGVLKTSAQIREGVSNSKYDPSVLPITDDPNKIRAQVEFYFGDANLPTDKFMWDLTGGISNVPVSIKKVCEFGRMRRFSPYSAIVSALRESRFLKVTGDEGEETVERKTPFNPDTTPNSVESRSVYAKGFGDEEPSSQFDIEAFFATYGPTNAVRLRRTREKLFKGSVFVEFTDEETAQKFISQPNKPLWKGEHELKIMSKKAYMELKMEEIRSSKIDPAGYDDRPNGRGRGRGRGRGNFRGNRGGRGNHNHRNGHPNDRDKNDWKKRREEDQASGFRNSRNQNNRKSGAHDRGRKHNENQSEFSKINHNKGQNGGSGIKEDEIKTESKDSNLTDSTLNPQEGKDSVTTTKEKVQNFESSPTKKRPHEENSEAEQGPSKKLNTNTDVPVIA